MYENRPGLETRTKIVATLGPACWESDVLATLIEAGVDVFRINCSHSDHASIRRQVARVRRATMDQHRPGAILLDLQGPKIRTSKVSEPLQLMHGDVLTVVMDNNLIGSGRRVGTTYPEMVHDVQPGDPVLFADGALSGEVVAVRPDADPGEVDIRIDAGGELSSNKGINLPQTHMSVPSLTDKDKADLAVGCEVGVDYVALSFIRQSEDARELLREMASLGASIPIVAKIEKREAVDNLAAILPLVDGVMVARGDLGVEVPIEQVPVLQKHIIQEAFHAGKLVITATQMLDSMERNPRPTRAETTDVANAILDGTDAVMLSGETAVGRYPVEAVRTMDRICREVEGSRFFRSTPIEEMPPLGGKAGLLCRAACWAVGENPRPLVVFTWTGDTARFVSKLRPSSPIYALSPNQPVVDQLSLAWGIKALLVPVLHSTDGLIQAGDKALLEAGELKRGDEIIVLAGLNPRHGATNFMKIHVVGDED